MYFYFCFEMNKCHSRVERASFLRETNLQHAMHNFYWYIIEYYFTSDPFSTEQRAHKMFSGRNIYAVGIEIVCIERYIGTFYFFFHFLLFCFTILFLSDSRVLCRSDGVGSAAAQHRVYGWKIFSAVFRVRLNVLCEAEIYRGAYIETRQTKRTPTVGTKTSPCFTSIFILMAMSSFASTETTSGSMEKSNYFFLHYGCFFPLLRNI